MSLVIAAHPIKDLYKIGLPARAVKSGRGEKVLEGPLVEREQAGAAAAARGDTDVLTMQCRVSPARDGQAICARLSLTASASPAAHTPGTVMAMQATSTAPRK